MMRIAASHMTEVGVGVCCPVHDAFLVEADTHELDDALEAAVAVGRTRAERRDFIEECFAQGWLQEAGSTTDKRIELTPAGWELSPSNHGESDRKAA